jgi:chromosome segregation ATPase
MPNRNDILEETNRVLADIQAVRDCLAGGDNTLMALEGRFIPGIPLMNRTVYQQEMEMSRLVNEINHTRDDIENTARFSQTRDYAGLERRVNKLEEELAVKEAKHEAKFQKMQMKLQNTISKEQARQKSAEIELQERKNEKEFQEKTIAELQDALRSAEELRAQRLRAWEVEHEKDVIERASDRARIVQMETASTEKDRYLDEAKSRCEQLKKELEELKLKQKEAEETIKDVNESNLKLTDKLEALKLEVLNLQQELDDLKASIAQGDEKSQETLNEIVRMENLMEKLKREIIETKEMLAENKKKMAKALAEKEKLEALNLELEEENRRLMEIQNGWWKRLNALRDEMKKKIIDNERAPAVAFGMRKRRNRKGKLIYMRKAFPRHDQFGRLMRHKL